MTIVLADVLVAGYQSGGTDGGGTPIAGELELADLPIEKPAASGDDAPTEEVSFNFGELKVDYFGGTSGAATSGIESGAGRDLLVGGLGSDNTGYAGQVDIASFSWSTETSAAAPEAAGPMKESMETMKKAWKDASASDDSGGVSIAVGDIDGSSSDSSGSAPSVSGGIDVMIAEIGERDSFAFEDSTSVSSLDGQTVRMFFRSGTDHVSGGGGDDLLIGGDTGFETLHIDVLASMGDTGSVGGGLSIAVGDVVGDDASLFHVPVSGRITAIASDPSDAPTLLFGDFDLV
jgi:hypothetical protein